jgi:hypothetical protein
MAYVNEHHIIGLVPSNRVLHKDVLVGMLASGKMGSGFFERTWHPPRR